ncbi:MAG: hypothetical protein ACRC1F_00040 [Metamycoplasmataceae bacterium]
MKSMKKIKLALATGSALVIPLALVASCSSSTVDYKITAKSNPVITQQEIEGEKYKSLTTLTKLFDGITETELANLDVTLNQPTSTTGYTITLKAKSGFTINDKETFVSNSFTISLTQITVMDVVDEFSTNDIKGDNFKSFATLSKLFEGLVEDELKYINVSLDFGTDLTITLRAKDGYMIGNKQELVSKPITVILSNVSEKANPDAILPTDITGENYKSFATLSKLFDNLVEEELEYIDVTLNSEASLSITLTAKGGFLFGAKDKISVDSKPFTISLSRITEKANPDPISISDIEGENYRSVATLSKLFDDVTEEKLKYIDVILNPGTTITLKAKNGFLIGDKTEVTSKQFTIALNAITEKVNPSPVTLEEMTGNNFKSFATLSKLFNGIVENHLQYMIITLALPTANNVGHVITFEARDGFTINNNQDFESKPFDVTLSELTNKPTIEKITLEDIHATNYESMETLTKLFNGLVRDELFFMDITLDTPTPTDGYTITLAAKTGFIIGNKKTVISKPFKIDFDITVRDEIAYPGVVYETDIETQADYEDPKTLNLFFIGIYSNSEAKPYYEITLNKPITPTDDYTITLKAKDGYSLKGKQTIHSVKFKPVPPTSLMIEVKSNQPSEIILADYDSLQDIKLLEQFFTITQADLDKIEVGLASSPNNKNLIRLTPIRGYIFEDANGKKERTLVSGEIDFKSKDLGITAKPTPQDFYQEDFDNFKDLASLQKLFDGINVDNLDKFRVLGTTPDEVTPGSGRYVVKLRSEIGYVFGTSINLTSREFTIAPNPIP